MKEAEQKRGICENKGALTIEASITYPIFLMIIVTILYIMRIVYTYGLIQHAVSQTARELSMYTYIYQISGANEINQDVQASVSGRTEQFNKDVGNVVALYEAFGSGDFDGSYEGATDPTEILKNIGSVLLGEGSKELNSQLFQAVVRPLVQGYIGADANGNSADDRLLALRVAGGLNGLNFSGSHFFEDGVTMDLMVCYTIEPLFPINIMPEMNLANRACVRGMSGKNVFSRKSIWDMDNAAERGNVIQSQEKVRNLPDQFPAFSAFDPATGTATAEMSIDLRRDTYQTEGGISGRIRAECSKMDNYRTSTRSGVTVKEEDIRKKVLIVYIPSSTEKRKIDRSEYDKAIKDVQASYPDIQIVTKEID